MNNKEDFEEKVYKAYNIYAKISSIITAIVLCGFLLFGFFKITDTMSRLLFTPFMCCGFCASGLLITKTFGIEKAANVFLKGFAVIFLLFWFGFISFWTVGIIKQEGDMKYILIAIPFYIFGIIAFYNYLIKH